MNTSAFVVKFDPVAFHIFGWPVHWYGITYLVGFLVGWWLARYLARRHPEWKITPAQVDDLLFYAGMGVILGGRIGYLLFYDMGALTHEPTFKDVLLRIIAINQGGMSFHGGFIGVLTAVWFFNRKYKVGYFVIMDLMAMITPVGLGAGRIGNFINGELWGKPSDVPWAMIFPRSGSDLPRHPSPLYEMLLEGVVLFIILWWFARKPRPTMAISGLFALCYGSFRIFVEFFRVPDEQLGYRAFGWLTRGMELSAPLVVVGVLLMWYSYHKRNMQNTKI
ncbi:MAG: prolipoprotein diacylglyceryl transferase [Gammaproteobacteria bacterium]|nr:prolipoprotein diacylglyceryl transferase [Gammaproteobacteria bacterium]